MLFGVLNRYDMSKPIKFVLAVMMMICLPLQGVAAAVMPFGMAHQNMVADVAAMDQDNGQMDHAMSGDMGKQHCLDHHAKSSPEKSTCDKSAHCPLCAIQAIITTSLDVGSDAGTQSHSGLVTHQPQPIPTLLFRPPA